MQYVAVDMVPNIIDARNCQEGGHKKIMLVS